MAAKVLTSSAQAATKRVLGAENTGVIAAVSTNAYHNMPVLIFIIDIDFPFYCINVWLLYSYCMRREFLQTKMILSILIISTSTIAQHRENLFALFVIQNVIRFCFLYQTTRPTKFYKNILIAKKSL